MTIAGGLWVGLLTVTMAVSVSLQAMGQSDETCIAYMEADAAYEPARREYQSAFAAADAAIVSSKTAWDAWIYAKAEHEVLLENAANPAYANLPDLIDHESARRNMEIALAKARAASAAMREAWDTFAAIANATEPARKKRNWAYTHAYKGPISSDDGIMNKLLRADRERCRQRFEW